MNSASGGPGSGGKDKVVRRVVLRPEDDPTIAKQFVDNIEQSYTGTDLAGALQLAREARPEPAACCDATISSKCGTRISNAD